MLENHYYEGLVEAGCDEAGRGCLAGPVYAAAVILPPDYHNDLLNDSKQLTAKRRYELREQIEHDAVAWAVGVVDNHEIDRINILRASILAMHRALDQLQPIPQAIIVDGNRFCPWVQTPQPPRSASLLDASLEGQKIGGDSLGIGSSKIGWMERSSTGTIKLPIRGEGDTLRTCISPPSGGWGVCSFKGEIPYTTIVKGDGKYLAIAAASILAKTYRDDFMLKIHEEYPMYHWDGNKGYPAKVHRDAIRQYGTSPYHRLTFNLLGESQQLELQFD